MMVPARELVHSATPEKDVLEADQPSGRTGTERYAGQRASVVGLSFAVVASVAAFLGNAKLLNGDGDLIRHVVIGQYILRHGPRFADPFSFSRPGEPFLAYEWLSQVAYASTHAIAGFPGVVALAAVLIGSAIALVVAYVRRTGGDPWLATVTGAAAAILTQPHWLARPHSVLVRGTGSAATRAPLSQAWHLAVCPLRLVGEFPPGVLVWSRHGGSVDLG